MQERLTREIAEAVWEAVAPAGVGVVVEAAHMCMVKNHDDDFFKYSTSNCHFLKSLLDDDFAKSSFLGNA